MDLKSDWLSQVFTPDYVAEFMVKNIKKNYFRFKNIENLRNVKVLEPCAGKGIFLKYLLKEGFDNITAYELDESLKPYLLNKFPKVKFKFENFLGANPNEKFDIIIGNPPYLGQNYNAELFQKLVENYPVCQKYFVGNMDLFYFFIHMGIIKLNPKALLSFITTNYWITKSKKTGIKKLKPHIINDCFLLDYIDLSKLHIFKKATGQHNCIFTLLKKSKEEQKLKIDKTIKIVQIRNSNSNKKSNSLESVFNQILIENQNSNLLIYQSALSNNDLSKDNSWNLLFSRESAAILKKIEKYCVFNNKVCYLKDYFIVRNGLILIKDDIFILKEGKNIQVKGNDIYIKIKDMLVKLNEKERERLKKLYKNNVIIPYNYKKDKLTRFLIYFSKQEFTSNDLNIRNEKISRKYPNLINYLNQFKEEMSKILTNAKENALDIYFPRRGSFIIQYDEFNKRMITNLEPYYDSFPKIFFKYISNSNTFGYTMDSYYATSDTYFLWPRNMDQKFDYLFLIAYLNSRLVKFLFNIKNIYIKRSKTKLEENLPVPNLTQFQGINEKHIISLIKLLLVLTIKMQNKENLDDFTNIESELKIYEKLLEEILINQIKTSIKELDLTKIRKVIDILLFELFHVEQKQIDAIENKYYNF